jgi:glutathionylspermidine synthase
VPAILASWERDDPSVYGRFDLAYDGTTPPKLLEYNADTPTALFEASVVQWEWLETFQPEADQFNSIHEKLVEAWGKFGLPTPIVHFTCVRGSEEDLGTVDYLRDTATQGKLEARHIYIDDIGWDGKNFRDLDGEAISALFKLYPWEWLMRDDFARNVAPSGVQMIEPAWKMVLSNKAILAILWEMFEGHPYLLPASFNPRDIDGPLVEKPILSREGANVRLFEKGLGAGSTAAAEGPYGDEPKIYQAYAPVAEYGGNHAVVGSWLIASQPAGIGMREDDGPITRNTSRFVPHFFR